jgi:hypothetical protein
MSPLGAFNGRASHMINPPGRVAPSASALRMARHCERRRKGLRCLTIVLRETEIDVLIGRGRLHRDDRSNPVAVRKALYGCLDDHLR